MANLLTLLLLFIRPITEVLCDQDVLDFTDKDFEIRISEYSTALVFFYAPWCSYCQRFKPDYGRAATELVRHDPPAALIQVDCTETGTETCEKYSISSYPTLKIFHYGEFHKNYEGTRVTEEIIKYVKAEAIPILKEVITISSLDKMLNGTKEVVVVGLFETKSDLHGAFFEVVKKTKVKCQFAFSTTKGLLIQLRVSDAVILFRPIYLRNKFEPTSVVYSGSADVSELDAFITKNVHGLAGIRKFDNKDNFKIPLIVVYFDVDYDKNPKKTNYWRNRVLLVSKEFEGKVTFAISSMYEFTNELSKVGIESLPTDTPVAIAYDNAGRNSLLKKKFSLEAIETFALNLLKGQMEIYVKSEPVPETQEGPVIIAVANNFKDVVLNNGKDTLIDFYDPECGSCKQLSSIFEELAEALAEEDIAIVKINAIANDIPKPFVVNEYPTVYWAPKDKKDIPEMFDGVGSVSNFIKFIAEKATKDLKGWDRMGNSKDGLFRFEL